jgi:hypothetical protein
MTSPRHVLILVPLFTSLYAVSAEQRGAVPPRTANPPAVQAPAASANLPAVQLPPMGGMPPQPGSSPPPLTQPVTGPAMTLPSSISMMQLQAVPTLCESVPAAAWAVSDARNGMTLVGGDAPPAADQIWYFATQVKNQCCAPNVSYSFADQQAAGCGGADSVNACMQKLTARCIRKQADAKNVRVQMQQVSQAAKKLSAKADNLANKADKLHGLLP